MSAEEMKAEIVRLLRHKEIPLMVLEIIYGLLVRQ